MSSEQLIPNAVGRLDDVVEALATGDGRKAFGLLRERDEAIRGKAVYYERLCKAAKDEMGEILRFMDCYAEDEGFRARVHAVCRAVRDET
jgi:hypothetical protein